MRIALTDDQRELQSVLRDLFAKECSPALVRELRYRGDTVGADAAAPLWRVLADTGILGLPFPGDQGGGDGSLLDLALVYEEAGRVLCPTTLAGTINAGLALSRLGTSDQAKPWIEKIAAGDMTGTVALWNPGDVADVTPRLSAEKSTGGWRLTGTLQYVANADSSDFVVVSGLADQGRILGFVVRPGEPGWSHRRHRTFANDSQCTVELRGYEVAGGDVLTGSAGEAPTEDDLRRLADLALALQCVEMAGGAEAVLHQTVHYLKQREQFGRPLASFQAVQHQIADVRIAVEGARIAAYHAVWSVSEGEEAGRAVAVAKLASGRAYTTATLVAHQLQGGMGYSRESDLHLWSERAKAAELLGGPADVQVRQLETALGLV